MHSHGSAFLLGLLASRMAVIGSLFRSQSHSYMRVVTWTGVGYQMMRYRPPCEVPTWLPHRGPFSLLAPPLEPPSSQPRPTESRGRVRMHSRTDSPWPPSPNTPARSTTPARSPSRWVDAAEAAVVDSVQTSNLPKHDLCEGFAQLQVEYGHPINPRARALLDADDDGGASRITKSLCDYVKRREIVRPSSRHFAAFGTRLHLCVVRPPACPPPVEIQEF